MEEDRRDPRSWQENLRQDIHDRVHDEIRCRVRYGRPGRGLSHLVIGLFIVVVGIALLLRTMDFPIPDLWEYWPVILIVLGLAKVSDSPYAAGKLWGGMVFLVGCGFLANNLHLLPGFHFGWELIWPLIIIYFGASMLLRGIGPGAGWGHWGHWSSNASGGDTRPDFNYVAMFGGGKRRIESKEFRGGSAVAIFGGYNIDLRDAAMAGESAMIDVNALFGGIDIRVPDTWLVEVRASAIFGGVDDKTAPPRTTPGVPPPKLIITGFAAFGGIVVKS